MKFHKILWFHQKKRRLEVRFCPIGISELNYRIQHSDIRNNSFYLSIWIYTHNWFSYNSIVRYYSRGVLNIPHKQNKAFYWSCCRRWKIKTETAVEEQNSLRLVGFTKPFDIKAIEREDGVENTQTLVTKG